MTAVSALLLALVAGWLVPAPRLAMAAFLGPWLVMMRALIQDLRHQPAGGP